MSSETRIERSTRAEPLSAALASKGRFFVFEGIDGSGKSTVSRRFAERLTAVGKDVVWTAEPTSSWMGDQVRRANREAESAFAETLLYVADRAEHTLQIRKWLEEGRWVVCDRYVGSTLAYQGVTLRRLMGPRTMEWLKAVNQPIIIRPDRTFLLKLDPELAMSRLMDREGRDKFEKLDFLRKVDALYARLAEDDPSYRVIDASQPVERVLDEAFLMIR
ncbi:dTMP kinase [Methanomassiliicoccus luminyensis]|uniref:dTMP kinase n=1 Tax=Methanomassiliicoccus luminyensis TaxID=1080712 RepID=UPI00036E7493|nr:dTMP kinase [Methanomassiliicoccus luminyensis]